MTPHPPSHAAALAAIGLGFELDPGTERDLEGRELLELRDAAAWLALAPPPIAAHALGRQRLMAEVAAPTSRAPTRGRRPLAVGLALSGVGLLIAAAAVLVAVRAHEQQGDWRRAARAAERSATIAGEQLRAARAELTAESERLRGAEAALAPVRAPELRVASFRGDGAGSARVLLDPGSRRWVVVAFALPALADKDYQLWLVPDVGAPISAGLLRRGAGDVLETAGTVPSTITSFRPAISLEPRGGSPTPTSIQMVGAPL